MYQGPTFKSAYVALMLLRSISWSARKLSSKEDVRRSRLLFPLLLILLLVEVASFGAMFSVVVFENAEGAAADRASAIRHFDLATQSLVEEPQKPAEKQSLYDKLVAYLQKKRRRALTPLSLFL